MTGLAERGYHTVCIGGVGFFNKRNPLGRVLPSLFTESHWNPRLGVTDPRLTENQARLAIEILARLPKMKCVFLFINVSALHEPNRIFLPGAEHDSVETQAAALAYVDSHLRVIFDAMRRRAPALAIICSDHGESYGEDGYFGHRVSHPVFGLCLTPIDGLDFAAYHARFGSEAA